MKYELKHFADGFHEGRDDDKGNELTNHIKTKVGKYQVLHSPSKNFVWIKNAKVAGTSMYRGVFEKEVDDLLAYKKNPNQFDKWWNSLTDEKLNDYFKFIFVRNPFDRCISAFSHIVVEDILQSHFKMHPILHPSEGYSKKKNLRMSLDQLYLLWNLFAKRGLNTYDINDESVHWMPQNILLECNGKRFVDYVGKYENLREDWKFIAKKFGVSETLPRVPVSQTEKNHGGDRNSRQKLNWKSFYIDLEIIDKVAAYYEYDIVSLGYKDKITQVIEKGVEIRDFLHKPLFSDSMYV